MKIKKTHGIPDVPEQNKGHKNMKRAQQGDTTKEMRIIPEEMTEREDKNENEVSGGKNANRKVSDPDRTKVLRISPR